jgi:hypothetical protein
MNELKRLFHFLGGIHLALSLIAISTFMVIVGTLVESRTESHLVAARWTYEHPFFLALLSLFFINILVSALRRWPFQKKHIPFLMTHLGLLMIIGGTILKNRWGLQGQLSVWEGSGNQHVLLPHTFALSIEASASDTLLSKNHLIALDSFQPNIYYPFHFPHLKCKLIGYAPHVKESLETWIKGSHAYIAGFPPLLVESWNPPQPFPKGTIHFFNMAKSPNPWSIVVLRTSGIQQALQQGYLKDLILKLKIKDESDHFLEIPLEKALQEPISLALGTLSIQLELSDSFFETGDIPSLHFYWQSSQENEEKHFILALQGQEALYVQSDSPWFEPFFTVDLIRPHPRLLLIEDAQENNLLFAFDSHGRMHGESFSASNLKTLISYDRGFKGYGVQAIIPIPTFSTSREDKENALAYKLIMQLQEALAHQPHLSPPLRLFEQACQKAQADFAKTFIEFLTLWDTSTHVLFHPVSPLPSSLDLALKNLNWEEISATDKQASLWISRLLDQLESSFRQGEHPLKVLEQNHWPFLSELQQAIRTGDNISPFNVLAQQIFSLTHDLPTLDFPLSPSVFEQAHLLSAYLRAYGIDYRSLCPLRSPNQTEDFSDLEAYWKAHSPHQDSQQAIVFETPLTHRITPLPAPAKLEECRPGIVLEIQQGQQKQSIALAYDPSGVGLKWPILAGSYLARFQPQLEEIPYRIRLRQARQIPYPQSSQVYSYESDLLISHNGHPPVAQTLSMNHVYETWDGFRFYLSGVATSNDGIKRIQLAVNHDPAKYFLTYPGAALVFLGTVLLFWMSPYRKK